MTTEVLRNMIYADSPSLRGLRYVVLDEVHYLQDPYRGPMWEEVSIHSPSEVDLVCLSATVSNAEEFADWVETVRGDTAAVIEERRPVELHHLYMVGDRESDRPHLLPTFVDGRPNPEAARLDARSVRTPGWRGRPRGRLQTPRRSVVIEKLTKFTGERHEFLTPGQYTQLTGRAGRRGIDDVGYAVVLWSPFVPFDQVAGLASTRTYALSSSFRPTYNMAANLVRRYAPDPAHHLLNLSFAQYRADSDVVRLETQLERSEAALAEARERAACERGDAVEYRRR